MNTAPLRIVFAGTPEFAASSLQALIDSQHEVIAVYTQPDRPAGRGRKLKASPVKELAIEHDLPVYQPLSLKGEDEQAELAALEADLMIVAAYGLLLPKAVLDTPKLGCINVHASLLPRWRGAAPIHRSLLAGDKVTGITIMQMDVGLDTGDMLYKKECEILGSDNSGILHDRLAVLGAEALIESLDQLLQGATVPEKQDDSLANYASKLEKQEGLIDWSQNAESVDRHIRGLYPWPVAFTKLGEDVVRVHQASIDSPSTASGKPGSIVDVTKDSIIVACGDDTAIHLTKIQLPGGKSLSVRDVLNSRKELFAIGTEFTQ